MESLYRVYDTTTGEDEFVMIAPMKTLSNHLKLRKPAEDRVRSETANGGTCVLHSGSRESGNYRCHEVQVCKDKEKKASEPIRIRIKDKIGNISYITVKDRKVNYFSATETPLALSNMAAGNAAELRFALEDAKTKVEAMSACRLLLSYADKIEVL